MVQMYPNVLQSYLFVHARTDKLHKMSVQDILLKFKTSNIHLIFVLWLYCSGQSLGLEKKCSPYVTDVRIINALPCNVLHSDFLR